MFRIGYRTIKTAIGVAIAISFAQAVGLNSFPSAGIITILCIQVTKKQSLRAAFSRFLACMIAMAFSTLFFEGIGFHPAVIGLMLLFFIPTAVAAKAKEGIVTSSVIILHIYAAGHVTPSLILNETGLIVIGITVALLMNLYMPSVDHTLDKCRDAIEKDFGLIFTKMVLYLRTGSTSWDGKEIIHAGRKISQGKALAFRNLENHVTRPDDIYYTYFKMREKQLETIETMLPLAASIPAGTAYNEELADFIEELSKNVHPYNTSHIYLGKLQEMTDQIHKMPLPESREEFYVQMAMVSLIKELEKYLTLKSVYKGLSRKENG